MKVKLVVVYTITSTSVKWGFDFVKRINTDLQGKSLARSNSAKKTEKKHVMKAEEKANFYDSDKTKFHFPFYQLVRKKCSLMVCTLAKVL